jgi:hypothetical protein
MNMHSYQLAIVNTQGEQEKLSELHTITEKHGTNETSLPEQQQILFNQLNKNMLAQNKPFKIDSIVIRFKATYACMSLSG